MTSLSATTNGRGRATVEEIEAGKEGLSLPHVPLMHALGAFDQGIDAFGQIQMVPENCTGYLWSAKTRYKSKLALPGCLSA